MASLQNRVDECSDHCKGVPKPNLKKYTHLEEKRNKTQQCKTTMQKEHKGTFSEFHVF